MALPRGNRRRLRNTANQPRRSNRSNVLDAATKQYRLGKSQNYPQRRTCFRNLYRSTGNCWRIMTAMQEWIDTTIDAHDVLLGPVDYFVDAGDKSSADFITGDFTKDGAWHTLSLASKIPTGTVQVFAQLLAMNLAANQTIQFRNPDYTGTFNACTLKTQVAAVYQSQPLHFSVNAAREVEYYFQSGTWFNIFLTIRGWIRRGV